MKRKLFKLFKKFFQKEFEGDIDIEIRLSVKRAIEGLKSHHDSLVERQALDLYTQQNWLVNPNHVFQVTNTGIPYLNLEQIKKEQARELQSQAKTLKGWLIWDILQNTVKQKAIETGFKQATTWEAVLPGKMMMHNLGIIDAIVTAMEKIDIDKINDGVLTP